MNTFTYAAEFDRGVVFTNYCVERYQEDFDKHMTSVADSCMSLLE